MSLQPSGEHLFQGEGQPMGGALLGNFGASGGWEGMCQIEQLSQRAGHRSRKCFDSFWCGCQETQLLNWN